MKKFLIILYITILINQKNCLNCSNIQNLKNKYICQIEKFPDSFFQKAFIFFKEIFSKKYNSQNQEKKRYAIFKTNYKKILVHNLTNSSFKQEVNNFTDLTENEFEKKFLSNFADETSSEDENSENDNFEINNETEKNKGNFSGQKEDNKIVKKKEGNNFFNKSEGNDANFEKQKSPVNKKIKERDFYYRYNVNTMKIERVYFE